jgi:hypothetical protein
MAGPTEQRGKPSLLDNIEGFFRAVVEGLDETKPSEAPTEAEAAQATREVGRTVEEVRKGDYIFRRTTIDEVTYEPLDPAGKTQDKDEREPRESP